MSKSWYKRHAKDVYTKKSKSENYRSRAAFKLLEINDKSRVLQRKKMRVLELGGFPGSWTQVMAERLDS